MIEKKKWKPRKSKGKETKIHEPKFHKLHPEDDWSVCELYPGCCCNYQYPKCYTSQ